MCKFLINFLFLIFTLPCFAAQPAQPMNISSDSSTVDRNQGIATFTGHVIFTQGDTHVTGDRLVAYFDNKNQLHKVIITGSLAQAWTRPNPEKPITHAQAQTITYMPSEQLLLLEGDGQIDQKGNLIKGPSLRYNLKTQILTTQPSSQGKTTIIIQPQSNSKPTLSHGTTKTALAAVF